MVFTTIKESLRWLVTWFKRITGPQLPPGPSIGSFSPEGGWPGTIVTIIGTKFTDVRDDHVVTIGGAQALVITAEPARLVVLAGEGTVTGPVNVTVGASPTITSIVSFSVLPIPDVSDLGAAGAPVFFHGPQPGTPQLGVADQPVLVVLTYPTDQNPGNAAQRVAALNAEKGRFEEARRFWREASYGTTSWKFDYTDWLALPADRNYYMWQPVDTYWGRHRLIDGTKRASTMRNGAFWGTHIDDLAATVQVNNPNSPNPVSYTSKQRHGTGIETRGDRAFITAGTDGLYVYDLVNSPATYVTRVSTGGYFADLDVLGNVCAVAALGHGLHLYDVSITAFPTLKGTFADAGRQVSAVCLAPNRAYIGVDQTIVAVDITNLAAPTILGTVDVGAFPLDLSLQGTTLIAATDGGGVVVLDVAAATPVVRSRILAVERVHAVCHAGTWLYVAGGSAGLAIYDASNPAAPVTRGSIALAGPAFDVIVDGAFAYVSIGRRRMAVVDVSNPAAPAARGVALLGAFGGGSAEADLTTLRASIDEAEQDQDLAQRYNALFVDALKAAQGAGHSLDSYKGVVVVVNGPFLRGASAQQTQFTHEDTGEVLRFNDTKGTYYVASGATWGRIAHEIGHWLGMWDIYEEWQADGTLLRGTAAPWCLSGNTDDGHLFCAHQINDIMRFYAPANAPTLTWSPTAAPLDLPFDIVAHDVNQDSDPNRVQVVKIVVSTGLMYFIEVRQRPNGRIFDQSITPIDATTQGAVIVLRAAQGTSISNTFERPVMLGGVLQVGQKFVDAARGLTISVESVVQNRPLVYRVRVRWNQFIPGDPNGKFDLTMTPWNTDIWDTPDIWIDSQRNNAGATAIYEKFEGTDNTRPALNGDRPWVKHDNTVMARIRNTGPQAVSDVYVSLYTASPPGIGDNGDWSLLETIVVPTIAGRDPAVPGSGEHVASARWQPQEDKHSCIKVAIFPQLGEIETNNNVTQENVFTFDSGGASSHDPVVIEAAVRSPFTIYKRVDLLVRGLPYGWHAVVDHNWVWTGPKGERAVRAVVWTDLHAPYDFTPLSLRRDQHIEATEALARIEGWTTFDDRYLPIGGLLADVKANRKVRMSWEVAGSPRGGIVGTVCLSPALADVPITIELTDRLGQPTIVHFVTGANGCADLDPARDLGLSDGDYTVQAFVTAGGGAAETETEPRSVRIN